MICERAREEGFNLLVELSILGPAPYDGSLRVVGPAGQQRITCAATGRTLGAYYPDEIPF